MTKKKSVIHDEKRSAKTKAGFFGRYAPSRMTKERNKLLKNIKKTNFSPPFA